MFLLKVLLILQDDNNEELFFNYIQTLKQANINLRNILISLQEKEIILKSYHIPQQGESFDPHSIQINKNFIKNLYKCSFELGKDLFENYPPYTIINECITTLRGVSKHFNSLEDAYYRYGKNIKWNPEIHSEIIKLIEWGKEHNMINQSLGSFIVNQGWNDLKAIKDGESININFNSIREL